MSSSISDRIARIAALSLIACAGACDGRAAVDESVAAFTPVCSTFKPTGPTLDRWSLTGGAAGPLGCVIGATTPAPTGHGSITPFANGQIVASPDQGPNMTVAVYQQGPELYLEWGDSTPYHYDRFLVRWNVDGAFAGQEDVPSAIFADQQQTTYVAPPEPRTRGVFAIPLPRAGTYSIQVEGCDYVSGGSSCNQSWTVPATITYVPPPPPPFATDCSLSLADGPIRQRWFALGGMLGPLGCPVSGPTTPPGGGSVVTFTHGQIGLAPPSQGNKLTVAAYQAESDLVVEWGDTTPFHYDKFNVRWNKDGQLIQQNEIRQPLADAGLFVHGIDHTLGLGPGTYTVQVEGCDDGTTSTCNQGFTFPLTVVVGTPTVYLSSCTTLPSGIIGQRWSRIVGANGPLLGCPLGPEQTVGNGRVQSFQNGQIAWSPDQGPDMTVAIYQMGTQLEIDWGDSFPYNYDKFILRVNGEQVDVTIPGASHIRSASMWFPYPNTTDTLVPNTVYTAIVEGCDVSGGNSTCNQKWTLPVSVTYQTPPSPTPAAGIDFTKIPVATSSADMATHLADRTLAVDTWDACQRSLTVIFNNEEEFVTDALAKLDLVDRGWVWCRGYGVMRPVPIRDEVNTALRFQQVQSDTGSSSDSPVCQRTGEYDTALSGLVPMVYKYGAYLDDDVRAHIVNDLLDARGPALWSEFDYCSVGVPETENHLNQIESARYLTNQLLYRANGNQLYNNETNGMNDFILARLQLFLQQDFLEYNSRPYTTYSVDAIQNLFDYATDRRVKRAAQLVLDYLSTKYALSSNTMRRSPPYRRRVTHYNDDFYTYVPATEQEPDAMSGRMLLTTGMVNHGTATPGNLEGQFTFGATDLQMAALSSYRLPGPVADFLFDPAAHGYFERIHHAGVEIYASRPDYLISAGGYYTHSPYLVAGFGKHDDDGAVLPTILLPTGAETSVLDLIRFDGFNKEADLGSDQRLNTCVAPDFACGIALRIPPQYMNKTGCVVQKAAANNQGLWIFVDAATVDPTRGLNCAGPAGRFMVAAYVQGDLFGDNRGFFEVHPNDGTTFAQFQTSVLANDSRTYVFDTNTPSLYKKSTGPMVSFVIPAPGDHNETDWTILSTGDGSLDALGTDITRWPLASGLMSGDGKGLVTFRNPDTNEILTLDFSDMGEPKRVDTTPRLPPIPPPPKCPPGGCM